LRSAKDLLSTAYQRLLESGLKLFIEDYINGTEITVGIFKNKALPVLEIIPPRGGWFDYKNKYSGETQEIPNSVDIDKKLAKKAQDVALKIHRAFDLGAYSRIDFIVSKGKVYVLELNTIPGLTKNSLFPKMIRATGSTFEEFIKEMIDMAIKSF